MKESVVDREASENIHSLKNRLIEFSTTPSEDGNAAVDFFKATWPWLIVFGVLGSTLLLR